MKQRYNSYKPSGIDWIGEIPSHWKVQRLKFTMNLINGRAYLQPELLSEGKYRILRVGNFFTNDSWYYSDMELEDNKYCCKGDLLYAWSASIGPYIWDEEKAIFHYHIWKVDLSSYMDTKYSFYLLDVITKIKLNDMHGSAMQHLTMENMNNSNVIVPPLREQEAIATWLDEKCGEIDAAIAKVYREIELIDELKQSEISRVVTRGLNPDAPLRPSGIDWIGDIPEHWKIAPIKNSFNLYAGATPKTEKSEYWDGEIIWITPADYNTDDHYVSKGKKNITKRGLDSCATEVVPTGSLIFSKRAPIGTVSLAKNPLCTNQGCISCIPKRNANSNFFYYLCRIATNEFEILGSGATFLEISTTNFANFKLPLPPLSEQKAIAEYLDKKCTEIDGLKKKLEKKRETLRELRQSIISEVVTGKRKVI